MLKPAKQCAHPGCPELTREKYCHIHKGYEKAVQREYERRYQDQRDPFYNSPEWIRARTWYGKRHPLCEDCIRRGITKKKDVVDHIEEIKDGGAKLDFKNFQSLCHACHNRKHKKKDKK